MSKATHPGNDAPETAAVAGLSFSQVIAAGLASAGAAVLTSRFGVTGTLLGAALTTMIITGGSAVLKNYLERMSGRVQSIGAKTNRRAPKAARPDSFAPPVSSRTSGGMAVYGRRRNPFGNLKRRSVFVGALIPALLAFGIAITAVTGVELTGGRTLSCLVWNEGCQTASADGSSNSTSLGRLTNSSSVNSGDGIQRQTVDGDSQNAQQTPSQSVEPDSGIFGNDNPNANSSDDMAPVTPGGSASDSDSADGSGSVATPGTGTGGGTPSDGVSGTAPEEEVPDYETPSTGTSDGTEEQTPTQTPSSSSRSSDSGVTPAPVTE